MYDNHVVIEINSCQKSPKNISGYFYMSLTNIFIERGLFELYHFGYTHRVISDKVHLLLVTLSYFRLDRFVQLLSLIPILTLLLYLLVSKDLVYTDLCELVPE